MIQVTLRTRPTRILDWDLENRPLSYRGDWPTADVTAIAWSWVGSKKIDCCVLGEVGYEEMLGRFRDAYARADQLSGHNLKKHDLPIVNGALIEFGLPILDAKITQDTLRDMVRTSGLPRDQESLCELFGINAPKYAMSQFKWRKANRLEAVDQTRRRVVADVTQHKLLAAEMERRGLLRPPKRWTP